MSDILGAYFREGLFRGGGGGGGLLLEFYGISGCPIAGLL